MSITPPAAPAPSQSIVTNNGDTVTDGSAITVTVTLTGGLTYTSFGSSSSGLFVSGDCSGTTTVTCTSSGAGTLAATGGADTLVLNVTAPGSASTGNINQANVSGGGEPSANNVDNISVDGQTFDVVAAIIDMAVTVVTHTGTVTGNNYLINSNTGTVSVTVQNVGSLPTAGTVTVNDSIGGRPDLQRLCEQHARRSFFLVFWHNDRHLQYGRGFQCG